MSVNLVTYYVDSTARAARAAETTLADFAGGCNDAASCAPGIGISTGSHSPTTSEWSQDALDERLQDSQIFGEAASGVNVIDATYGATALVGFAPTTGVVAIDGIIDADVDGTGFAIVNRTGATIPSGVWCWGVANNP
jgi:hypothetical protein